MVWSFLWRAALYVAVLPKAATWLVGLTMGLGGASAESVRTAAMPVQAAVIVLALVAAYFNAKSAQAPVAA